ncbi:hypothetical protein Ttaiw_01610 [Tepidimonas taiwanensis]|uniref:DUF2946 domain-containing protein n=1 Tax=Tepidimonas taiwanensis TaxID=307486 RepID=A0A554X5X2_9BURK|nr:hypothetical protein Ttaiw_01610 [Tepidimonas taiwanensis]
MASRSVSLRIRWLSWLLVCATAWAAVGSMWARAEMAAQGFGVESGWLCRAVDEANADTSRGASGEHAAQMLTCAWCVVSALAWLLAPAASAAVERARRDELPHDPGSIAGQATSWQRPYSRAPPRG